MKIAATAWRRRADGGGIGEGVVDSQWAWLLLAIYTLILLVLVREGYLHIRQHWPHARLHFSITDIWGLMLGFTPSLLAGGVAISEAFDALPYVVALALGQLFGAFIGLMILIADEKYSQRGQLTSAYVIFLYSLLGCMTPLVIGIVISLGLGAIAIYAGLVFSLPEFGVPITLILGVFIYFFIRTRPTKSEKPVEVAAKSGEGSDGSDAGGALK